MTENEQLEILRDQIEKEYLEKARIYKAKWRAKNREHIRQYNKTYRMAKKMRKRYK